jgi:pimeloyl-ACP methyl ester carboxylesterase
VDESSQTAAPGNQPANPPFIRSGHLAAPGFSEHRIYWEEYGSLTGEPVIVMHGGPGAGSHGSSARFFNPQRYRVVLFDQRGCGKTTPSASEDDATPALTDNTTQHLIADVSALRRELNIDGKMHVFGGSWGSTLALAYAIAYPATVQTLILRGVFLCRRADVDYFFQGRHGSTRTPPLRLAYRRVIRALSPCALTRTDAGRPAEERQKEAMDAAIAEYRRLSPLATGDLPSTPVAREWGRGKSASQNVHCTGFVGALASIVARLSHLMVNRPYSNHQRARKKPWGAQSPQCRCRSLRIIRLPMPLASTPVTRERSEGFPRAFGRLRRGLAVALTIEQPFSSITLHAIRVRAISHGHCFPWSRCC